MATDVESPGSEEASAAPHRAAVIYQWVQDHLPKSRGGRITLALVVAALVLVPSLALLLLPIWVDMSQDRFATFGYTGVFVANLASTATVFIPVPGLTAAGQALILQQGDIHQGSIIRVILVGLAGGTGMALGEVTAYAAGSVGSEVAREGQLEVPRLARPLVHRLMRWIDWLMHHYGFATLLVLSAVPNPAFELAGITAGAVRMSFPRFMVAVLLGKNARGLLLAFLGAYGINLPYIT